MRKHKLLTLLLVFVMVASAALTGCGNKTPQNQQSQSGNNEQKLDADQTLRIVGYDFKSLDPSAESDAETFTTFTNVYEGLFREVSVNGQTKMVLAGAKDMKVSADGLVYTFTLRDDAKWSDGKPVTAKDYEFSWKRLINPDTGYDYMHFIDMVKNVPEYQAKKAKLEDVGIKALDDKTLQVTLSTPTPYFDKLLAFSGLVPQREDMFNSLGKDYGQAWDKMVYNGPFVIAEYAKGSKIVYKKNPNYWDAKNVKLEKAECPIISEQATLIQMFQAKQLDQVGASGDYIKQLDSQKDAGGYDHITGTDGSVFYIIFNMKNPVLQNLKVRKALIAAFDKKAFLDTVFKRNIVSYGLVADQISIGDKIYRKEVPEPQKAVIDEVKDPKALLLEGLKELNISDPSQVKLKMLNGQQTSLSSAIAQFTQNQLESKLGIKVEIQFSVDSPAYFQARSKGEFDLCQGGWGPDYNDVSTYFGIFLSTDGNNNGKYSNAKYDELVTNAGKEMDPAKRLEMYKQAEKIAYADDPAVISTYYRDLQTFRYKWVKGLYMPMFGGYYSLKDAYIQGRQ